MTSTMSDRHVQTSLSLLQSIFGGFHPRSFAVRLWDGTTWGPGPGQPARFTFALKHPGALRAMFFPPTELSLAEAYLYDDFDIEGDIERVFDLSEGLLAQPWGLAERARIVARLVSLPAEERSHTGRQAAHMDGKVHCTDRDRDAIRYHYDVSNDFYALWLDKNMVYSCAYFRDAAEDLDAAQERKLEYICRKLRLRPGERLLDIGCGWGGLVAYAARMYDADSLGITISEQQVRYAGEWIARAGLSDRCRVEARDYREMDDAGSFDKLVSVGMFEHVGQALLPEYFRRAYTLLRPGGAFLNHGIACRAGDEAIDPFSDRYVFPDGELVPISATLQAAEDAGFEVRDVESLREHYALTLRHWVRRLEARHDEAVRATDEVTYRVWRLFMSGSAHGFTCGRLNVYQALLVKPDQSGCSRLPLTREDCYR